MKIEIWGTLRRYKFSNDCTYSLNNYGDGRYSFLLLGDGSAVGRGSTPRKALRDYRDKRDKIKAIAVTRALRGFKP